MWQGEMKRETDWTLTLKVPGCIYLGKWLRISVLNYEMEILINNLKWLAGTAITYSFGQHSRHVCGVFLSLWQTPEKKFNGGRIYSGLWFQSLSPRLATLLRFLVRQDVVVGGVWQNRVAHLTASGKQRENDCIMVFSSFILSNPGLLASTATRGQVSTLSDFWRLRWTQELHSNWTLRCNSWRAAMLSSFLPPFLCPMGMSDTRS